MTTMVEKSGIEFVYTNHMGLKTKRFVIPIRLEYGTNPHIKTQTWLLHAYDLVKNAERAFVLEHIEGFSVTQ
jgi:predicted DNA-binding transcriptional regulator YafY